MKSDRFIYTILSVIWTSHAAFGVDFSFNLPDSEEQCFHERVLEGVHCQLDYQVLAGGSLDVDVTVTGPNNHVVYKEVRKEYDTIAFNTTDAGEYTFCFSNEFSTFTHKSVYVSIEFGDENLLFKGIEEHVNVMTFMEATADEIHRTLNDVIDGQTHYRLQEAHGKRFAEDLNERVLWWSLMQTFVIFAVTVSQVLILRNFFSEPRLNNKPAIPARQPRYGYSAF